jgi:hypothetical protein
MPVLAGARGAMGGGRIAARAAVWLCAMLALGASTILAPGLRPAAAQDKPPAALVSFIDGIQPSQVFVCKGTKASIPFRAEAGVALRAEVVLASDKDKNVIVRQEWPNVAGDPKAPAGSLTNPSVVLSLDNVPLGGEYTIRFTRGLATAEIQGILMGEIWVVGGGANAVGAPAKYPPSGQVHTFNGTWSNGVIPLFQGPPDLPKGMMLVSPWLYAAAEYADKRGIPVGLVGWARPGMTLREALDPQNGDSERVRIWVKQFGLGATVFGWYQGEGDALLLDGVRDFGANLKRLVASMRETAANPQMLAVIVQLGTVEDPAHPDSAALGRIRNAQRFYCADDPQALLLTALPCARRDTALLSDEGSRYLGLSISEVMVVAAKSGKPPQSGPRALSAHYADDTHRRVVVEFDAPTGLLPPEAAACFLVSDAKHLGAPQVLGSDVASGVLTLKVEGGRVTAMDPAAGGQEVHFKIADSGFVQVTSAQAEGASGVMLELVQAAGENPTVSYCLLDNAKGLLRGSDGKFAPAFADLPIGEQQKNLDARLKDAMKRRPPATPSPAPKPAPGK